MNIEILKKKLDYDFWKENINYLSVEDKKELKKFLRLQNIDIKKKLFPLIKINKQDNDNNKTNDISIDDLTMDFSTNLGYIHCLTYVKNYLQRYMISKGFIDESNIAPLVDTEDFNFTKLNIPKNHPTRDDMQSFFTENGKLLRTHTTNAEPRLLKKYSNENFKVFVMGSVFRNDNDSTHTPIFHQMEMIQSNISISEFLNFLKQFLYDFFGEEKEIRLRPAYFPFTEPSYEIDVKFGDKWLEVLGCGVLHKNIFKQLDLPFRPICALGVGIERLAMLKYNISDIRTFYSGDAYDVIKNNNKIIEGERK